MYLPAPRPVVHLELHTTDQARASAGGERQLLEAARRGDEDAYGRLVGPYRAELDTHCYRMLGSAVDAEDALQETLLRAWRALPQFEGRSSLRSWLYKIATNACLRAIERRPKRVLPIDYASAADPHDGFAEPVTETVWLEPYPDDRLAQASSLAGPAARYEQRESVELAFIAALQHLPARQRAVLIIRDVLGFSARETAEALETTSVSVDSALQRAHKTVDERLPEQSQQATLRSLGDAALSRLVERYVAAWERNDVDAVVAMLAEDARMTMPPLPTWYRGRQQVGMFLRGGPLAGAMRWRLIPARANGQLAFGCYIWDEDTQTSLLHGVNVLTLRGTQIEETTTFLTPGVFRRFGLPDRLYSSFLAACASSATCSDVRDSAESRCTPRIRSICCSRW
jgi:RNA polymerase sigma-70 factor (ECF subfamily)